MNNSSAKDNAVAEAWGTHAYGVGTEEHFNVPDPEDRVEQQHKHIEPWLSAVFQSEHFSLLLGSGFTKGVARAAGGDATGMDVADWTLFGPYAEPLRKAAIAYAKAAGRGQTALLWVRG